METRILIPEHLVIITSSIETSKTKVCSRSRKNSRESAEILKPSSSGIDLDSDSENEEKMPDFVQRSESSNNSSSSTSILSSDNSRNSSLSSSHSNSECDSDNVPGTMVSSDVVDRSRSRLMRSGNTNKNRKQFRKIQASHRDEVKIYAKQRIDCGISMYPNEGEVQIISLRGIESLVQEDIRFLFGCFDRVTTDPQNNGNKIRLCNWIRFVRRSFNSFDSRVNLVGKFVERKPVLEFIREILPDQELIAFFDVTSLNYTINRGLRDSTDVLSFNIQRINNDVGSEVPLDLSKSSLPPKLKTIVSFPKSSEETEDQHLVISASVSPDKFIHRSNAFLVRNVLQPMTMKLFQPHLYSPIASLATSITNPTFSLSPPTNSNSASTLNSPNSNSISQSLSHSHVHGHLGLENVGLLRPILRTRGRERSLLPCDVCGKAFDRPSLLKRHMRTHTGEKPHICDVCNKGFSTSSSLNTHRRIHSGEKPHQCPMCGKCFTASSNLYYHKMTHNKEKPHKCLLCGKSFPTPGDLKSHQYVHSGSWPHNCHVCHRGFSKQTNLRNHILLHSGDKPHSCRICEKRFALACNLRAHLRTHVEDPAISCVSCKRTFLTSLNMLVNGQCRPCILHLQQTSSNNIMKNNSHSNSEINLPLVKIEPQLQPDVILPPTPALLHGFHLPPSHPGLFHDSLGFNSNRRPNPFLEQLFEWNWRFAKETAGNLGLMQQKLLESQMLAAQLMSVSNSPGISDILRFRPNCLPHSGDFAALDGQGLGKFTP